MRTAADLGSPVTVHVHRSRMRALVQVIGAIVLGLLLPEDPDTPGDRHDRCCPRHR
jgi:hypothetical protein